MIQFPNAKINLGLSVVKKREDGFHDLETIFYPIALFDCLEFIVSNKTSFALYSDEETLINTEENTVWKAYDLLQKKHPTIPALNIQLLKKIPSGAGLGGGSADGSFMLMMLNKYFQLKIPKEKLLEYALSLGSDCPFFIYNTPCFATGQGEKLSPISLDLSAYTLIIVKPKIHISTAWAFSQLSAQKPSNSILEVIQKPIVSWRDILINDFQSPIENHYPQLKEIRQKLYSLDALYASMSGSGSSYYAFFDKKNFCKHDISKVFSDCNVYFTQ
ncbi:MAG: 4-(cytidine 5'-diphospho)-2-C-methyl-D-erythritol kinase [Chitinophagaceae bacterium]